MHSAPQQFIANFISLSNGLTDIYISVRYYPFGKESSILHQ